MYTADHLFADEYSEVMALCTKRYGFSCNQSWLLNANLLIEGNLLQVWQSPVGQVGLAGTNGGRATKSQVVEETVAECTPGVKLTLKALNVGQEVDDVQVGVVLPGGNSGLDLVVLGTEQCDVVWAIAVAGTQVTCTA